MGSVDRDEDRTFKVNFSGDGVAKLRERVSDKLKEFMGDYTDDTLVEYVIVLLRNGRRKREAKNELNVFLGNEDSDSFVSWLWDHLSSSLELYVQSAENHADKAVKTKLPMEKRSGRDESPNHIDSELEKGKPEHLAGNRHKREWKGLVRDTTEPPPLRSSVVDNVCSEEKTHHKASCRRKSASPDPPQQKKRSRHDERQHMKRESVSQATSAAPRRLLQFAVRDAVGNLRQSVVVKEPSQNRLRSVVSASSEDLPMEDPPRRLQSIARVPNPMASVIRAVQEAADDVRRVKSSGSVFDRLGRGVDISETGEQVAEFRDATIEEEGYEEFNQIQEQAHSEFLQRSDYGHVRNLSMMDCETGLASDLVSENEGYNVGHRAVNVSQIGTSGGNKGGDSFRVKYTASNNLDRPLPTANTSRKTVNISVNVDTWKPLYYQQDARNATETDNLKSIQENVADPGKPDARLMKENSNLVVVGNGNAKPPPDIQSKSPKTLPSLTGSYTAGRPSEDADSRTIFVSNVHFAATKDSLSRHFNKFGEVLKVVIVTDAATGQPKGSAYVEFMRKEAADNALSLDGTSFMSRILKITKRSSSNQEAPPAMTWPRIAHGSPYPPARFARVPFPRGIPGAFRARPPMKTGARSFQWKRDTQTATDDGPAAAVPGNTLVSSNARSLTYVYVRPESKQDGSTGTT